MDAKDEKILLGLVEDGRASVVDLARKLEMPRATVQDRIRKMMESGVIRKFVAVPDYAKIGKEVTAFVLVSFKQEGGISQRRLAEQIAKIPDIYEVSLISGEWDIIVKVKGRSVLEIGSLVIDRIRMIGGVENTQTCVCFQTIKETP